jgi:hypothetical protein
VIGENVYGRVTVFQHFVIGCAGVLAGLMIILLEYEWILVYIILCGFDLVALIMIWDFPKRLLNVNLVDAQIELLLEEKKKLVVKK